MHRRNFVGCLIVNGLAFSARNICRADVIDRATGLAPIKNIPPGFDIYSLAREYLKAFPQFGDRTLLVRAVADSANTPELMNEAIANDFDRGATLRIGGWVCADMELKLCVLHARKWI